MYTERENHIKNKGDLKMKNTNFGIEIEFTGITREQAAKVAAETLNGTYEYTGTYYDTYTVTDQQGRKWKFMSDGSIRTQSKLAGSRIASGRAYSVEMVSPILTYENDIEILQETIRALRKRGGFTNSSTGIHIHIDGQNHTARTIRNFVNIIASKNDLFYKALAIEEDRMRFCQKMDQHLVNEMNKKKPQTLEEIENIWYEGYWGDRDTHYHSSRYHFLNLHSFFHGHHTVELRGFNSTLHAGKVRSYIALSLALNDLALNSKKTSSKKPQVENEKFAMRTFLNRIGLIGDEFKNCREHLTKNLEGSSAWRFGQAA